LEAKTKRYFQRISTGQLLAKLRKNRIRLITLTSSDNAKNNDISRDADVLIKRIRRKVKNFQYWKVNVLKNGRWHIHILYTGKYIPKYWLSQNWKNIHNSYIVDIRSPDNNRKIANYMVNQYLSDQDCEYTRMSYSQKWLYKGCITRWKNLVKSVKSRYYYNQVQNKYYKNRIEIPFKEIMQIILKLWAKILYLHTYPQTYLTDYG